jgi:hypothetical protein
MMAVVAILVVILVLGVAAWVFLVAPIVVPRQHAKH